jgi:hypothetical protein
VKVARLVAPLLVQNAVIEAYADPVAFSLVDGKIQRKTHFRAVQQPMLWR